MDYFGIEPIKFTQHRRRYTISDPHELKNLSLDTHIQSFRQITKTEDRDKQLDDDIEKVDEITKIEGPIANKGMKTLGGVVLTLISTLLKTIQIFWIRELMNTYNYSAFEQLFVRGFVFLGISLVAMSIQKVSIADLSQNEITFLKLRTICVIIVTFTLLNFLSILALSTLMVVFFTYPIITPFLARIILKDPIKKVDILALLICVLGLIFILKPSFMFGSNSNKKTGPEEPGTAIFYIGIGGTLILGVIQALNINLIRKSKATVNAMIVNLGYGIPCIIISSLILSIILQITPHFTYTGLLMISGCHAINFVAMICQYLALKLEKPTMVALVTYSQVLFTYIGEILFYAFELGVLDIIGGALIMFSAIFISIYKYRVSISTERN